jgi:cytochrome bd ubiquinol oxidase subunit II
MGIDLPVIWALIIAFGLMMYVVMDGFDLGIGILFPLIRDRRDRDTMVNTVAPVWDGNETWLALGGASLMGVFPLAYSVLLSALYIPIFFMLAGLIWRGVAFEFRFKADEAIRHSGTRLSPRAPTWRPFRKASRSVPLSTVSA